MAELKWIPWILLVEAVAIVTGNVTVLVIFTRTPSLRKRKYYLLVSLAVADLLVGLLSVPTYSTIFFSNRTSGRFYIFYKIQDILFGTASVFGLAAVAIERVYAVYFPFKHRTLTKGTYIIGIAVVWVMAILFAVYGIFDNHILLVFTAVAWIVISLIMVIISYSLIWIKMNCMSRIQDHAIDLRDRKMTVTVLMVTVVSLIAWIPFQVVTVLTIFCPNCLVGLNLTGFLITKFLHYSNSLVNPIIYALRMPQFKKALLNQLHCCIGCYSEHGIDNRHKISANLYNNGSNTIESHNYKNEHGNNSSDHGNNSSDHCNRRGDHDINRSGNVNNSSENSQKNGDHEKCMKYDNISSYHGNNRSDNENNKGDHNHNLSSHSHHRISANLYNSGSCHDDNTIESHNHNSDHGNNSSDHDNNSSDHSNNSSKNSHNIGDYEMYSDYGNNRSDHGNNSTDHCNSKSDHDINRCDHDNNSSENSENSHNSGDYEKCSVYDNISSYHARQHQQ